MSINPDTLTQQEFYDYLINCSDAYYNTGTSAISDSQFDQYVAIFEQKFDQKFTYIGSATQAKAKLPAFMPSLNKCKDTTSLTRFCKASIQTTKYVYSEKLDGISLLLHYTTTGLKLYTRGDGATGSNVDHLKSYLAFPKIDAACMPLLVRGELIIAKQHIEELGQALRNIICGAVMAKTPDVSILQHASFVAYAILEQNMSASNMFHTLQKLGFKLPLITVHAACTLDICDKVLTDFQQRSSYQIDGIVVAKDVYIQQEDTSNPKHIVAFKRAGVRKQTKVIQVQWNQSRYGKLHPVVVIEPVVIDGCTIQCASGFHAAFIRDNSIGPGALIEIERSGDVIPNIVQVITKASEPQIPDNVAWDGVHISNKETSTESMISRLTYSFKILGAKGVSEQTVRKLFRAGLTTEVACWNATSSLLTAIEGIQEKSASNLLTAFRTSKANLNIINLLLISACFNTFGEKKLGAILDVIDVSRYLRSNHLTVDEVTSALAKVHIREAMANAFMSQCANFRKSNYFMQLLSMVDSTQGDTSTKQVASKTSTIQHNIKVVFSGFRDSTLVEQCHSLGIAVSLAGVSKTTNILVLADVNSASSKASKATELNIPIMSKDDFIRKYISRS